MLFNEKLFSFVTRKMMEQWSEEREMKHKTAAQKCEYEFFSLIASLISMGGWAVRWLDTPKIKEK